MEGLGAGAPGGLSPLPRDWRVRGGGMCRKSQDMTLFPLQNSH